MFGYLVGFNYLLICRFGLISRSFHNEFFYVEGDLFTNYFVLVPLREDNIFMEDHVTTPNEFPVL